MGIVLFCKMQNGQSKCITNRSTGPLSAAPLATLQAARYLGVRPHILRMARLMAFTLPALSAMLYMVAIAMFASLHRRAPETSWVRDAVSDYGVGPAARYFRIYGHVGTLAAALLATQFALSKSPEIPRVAVVSMFLLFAFRIGVFVVPTDKPDAPASTAGRVHLLFAIASFAATYTAIANASPALATAAPAWLSAIMSGGRFTAMVSLAGVVATMLPPLKKVFGLMERVFLLSSMLWFLAANVLFLLAASAA